MDYDKFKKYTHMQEQGCHASCSDCEEVCNNELFLHTSKVCIGVHLQKNADTYENKILY